MIKLKTRLLEADTLKEYHSQEVECLTLEQALNFIKKLQKKLNMSYTATEYTIQIRG